MEPMGETREQGDPLTVLLAPWNPGVRGRCTSLAPPEVHWDWRQNRSEVEMLLLKVRAGSEG